MGDGSNSSTEIAGVEIPALGSVSDTKRNERLVAALRAISCSRKAGNISEPSSVAATPLDTPNGSTVVSEPSPWQSTLLKRLKR